MKEGARPVKAVSWAQEHRRERNRCEEREVRLGAAGGAGGGSQPACIGPCRRGA